MLFIYEVKYYRFTYLCMKCDSVPCKSISIRNHTNPPIAFLNSVNTDCNHSLNIDKLL